MVINDFIRKQSVEQPDTIALVYNDLRLTYRQYDEAADRAAQGLLDLGVKRGDRVGIYVPNWPEFLYTYLGTVKIGAVAVPVSWRFTSNEVKFTLQDSEISTLVMAPAFYDMDMAANLEAVKDDLPLLQHIVIVADSSPREWMILYNEFAKDPTPSLTETLAAVEPEDTALFIYTSGTTGAPKATMLTHRNIIAYTRSEIAATNFTGDDSIFLDIPLNHVGASVMGVISCIVAGARLVMVDMFDPEDSLRIIQEEKITVMGQVPAQYALQLLHPNAEKYDLSSVKKAIVSSQPCPTDLLNRVRERLGIYPTNAYGLTEATGAFTFTRPGDGVERLTGTVGVPIDAVEVAIVDRENNRLFSGEVGEIIVRGDTVMKGYYNRPEQNARAIDKHGWLHTGDMGSLDDDGYLTISGRKKEMYIRGGENVYPPEVEEAIAKHPNVFMNAVVGRPDPIMGEVGRAYVIPVPGTSLEPQDIIDFLQDRLANYKIPVDVIIRDSLPTTPLGKVKKLDLYDEVAREFGAKS